MNDQAGRITCNTWLYQASSALLLLERYLLLINSFEGGAFNLFFTETSPPPLTVGSFLNISPSSDILGSWFIRNVVIRKLISQYKAVVLTQIAGQKNSSFSRNMNVYGDFCAKEREQRLESWGEASKAKSPKHWEQTSLEESWEQTLEFFRRLNKGGFRKEVHLARTHTHREVKHPMFRIHIAWNTANPRF